MMSMYVRDEKRQDIFYSLMTGTDISDLSYRYNLSIRELIFMYEEGVREVSRCWESLVQEQQRLQSVHLRCRNYKAVLHRNNVVCGQFKVFVPLKEYDIPAECVDKLSTPLEYLEIQPRILRNLRRYNIYLLEDLLRFIKKNGFDALGKLHGVGKRSCEDLYLILKIKIFWRVKILVICFVIFLYRIDILHCFTFDWPALLTSHWVLWVWYIYTIMTFFLK